MVIKTNPAVDSVFDNYPDHVRDDMLFLRSLIIDTADKLTEIDLVEEHGRSLHGYEFKWSPKKVPAAPKAWAEGYPQAKFDVIHSDNYQDFIIR